MSAIQPDRSGFAAAQENLRKTFGSAVRFYQPSAIIYDPSLSATEFDDEGIPLDPLAGASAINADTSVDIADLSLLGSAMCNVVFNPLQTSLMRRDQTYETQLAIRSGLNKDLILDPADYPLASAASHFQIGKSDDNGDFVADGDGELWKVVNVKPDNAIGSFDRYIVYGQGTR